MSQTQTTETEALVVGSDLRRRGQRGLSRGRTRGRGRKVGFVVASLPFALLFLFPLLYIIFRSFLPASADAGGGIGLDSVVSLTADNYAQIFSPSVDIGKYLWNSTIVSVGTAVVVGIVSTLAGYALSRISFAWSAGIFILLLAPLVVPYQGLLTPLTLVLGQLGLLNSLAGVIIVVATLQLPFSVFVMRNTFDAIPKELEEAAQLDGASTMKVLTTVMIPLAWPGLLTVVLFAFMAGWNDLLTSVVFLSDDSKYTLPIAFTSLTTSLSASGVARIDPGVMTATAVIATAPVAVLFLVLQKSFTRGLLGGAIK